MLLVLRGLQERLSIIVLYQCVLISTFQSVDSPLFKLLEGDVRGWWEDVEVQALLVLLLSVFGVGELLLLIVDLWSSLDVNSSRHVLDNLSQ